jgi:lysozyme family protein
MSDASWDAALAFVLSVEGGFTDDPVDPGGVTNLGITHNELAVWRRAAVSIDDMRNLGKNEAGQIYRANYWAISRCADLAPGVDLLVFDGSVNTGNGRSARLLQGVLGVKADGQIGPITVAAANAVRADDLVNALADARQAFYQNLPTFMHFGRGWTARVVAARAAALAMVV